MLSVLNSAVPVKDRTLIAEVLAESRSCGGLPCRVRDLIRRPDLARTSPPDPVLFARAPD